MDKYYVYKHIDLDTKEVVYIGMGSGGRAWLCGNNATYGRGSDHRDWVEYWLNLGTTPDEFVEIIDRGISREEALDIEKMLIHELKPRFNKNFSRPTVLTTEQVQVAREMRQDGMSFSKIAAELETSTMTVYRAIKGETLAHKN